MKTKNYIVEANIHAGKKFYPAEYIFVGEVIGKNKLEALQNAQLGIFTDNKYHGDYERNFKFKITLNK